MRVKCDYCGQLIEEELSSCPFCGGSLSTANRVADSQPKTIEELKQWYTDHKLPPEEITRFFIGKDIRDPKAFGIYQDGSGDFVVNKNKSNGERAVRYQGKDEGYAVNELYQRLRAEISDQKGKNAGKSSQKKNEKLTVGDIILGLILLPFFSPVAAGVLLLIVSVLICALDTSPAKGYYNYNGNDYYYQGSSWYYYDPIDDIWDYVTDSEELDSVINKKTDEVYRTDSHDGTPFEESTWYDSGTSDDSYDWDSDSSWSDSSWDSGSSWDYSSTDWDSDW